ncbi:hypothetical protein DM02DRAFT_656337 [Periconia macrospinosa]|uniref:C2H2-type domain-containing protein n=1 Tax=Periconia macrospinosa TaxID=97972 RepID=A0A2V1DMX9_9PLEO|nr:hypothetical protein DM02DRAFT_656337 [Periconia macrospinosa]
MTQQNHHYGPIFTIDGQNFLESQSSQVPNSAYQQWNQNMRSMGPIPSPSSSQRNSMSAPSTAPLLGHGMNRPTAFHLDGNMDSKTLLAVPQSGRTRSPIDNNNTVDPSLYSPVYGVGIHDEPWSSLRTRNNSAPTGSTFIPQSSINYNTYRDGPGSDISDSGYYTHHANSVSNEPERVGQELPEMIYDVGKMTVASSSSEPTEVFPLPSDQTSQYSGRSANTGKAVFKCDICKDVSKCPSDYKKHMLKHDKPHVCDVQGCRRAAVGKGFTTKNDLDRHKKSVHRVGVEKGSYQCASEHCRNRGKIWPRLDNFKQHINRMHKDEDEHDLISRSVYQEPYTPTGESLRVAPLDTTLAGIGTDKQFAGNDLDDPASGISLTPDQDSNRWNSFDPTARGFALDVDQTSNFSHEVNYNKKSRGTGLELPRHSRTSRSNSGKGTRPRQDSLQVLADADAADGGGTHPHLSNAPQTKAEQQKQAFLGYSRYITEELQNGASAEYADLEDVVLKVLYDATSQSPKEATPEDKPHPGHTVPASQDSTFVMTPAELSKVSKNISDLIKQSHRPQVSSTSRRSSKALSPNRIQCERCDVTVSRSCDMKKHMKRHTKPYGCTYPKCFKRFGAKSDWKRHENNQHYQQEAYLCNYKSTTLCLTPSTEPFTPCGHLCYRPEQFKSHLLKEHKISDPQQLKRDLKERKIGMGNQRQFWCGFCRTIVPLREKRNAAWDERFDHIDEHFSKQGKSIEDWTCLEANRVKGELKTELDSRNFDNEEDADAEDEDGDDADADGIADDDDPLHTFPTFDAPPNDPPPLIPEPYPTTTAAAPCYFDSTGLGTQSYFSSARKRQVPLEDTAPAPMPKRSKNDVNRYCVSHLSRV